MLIDTGEVDFRLTGTHFDDFSQKFPSPPPDLTNRSCPSPPPWLHPPGDVSRAVNRQPGFRPTARAEEVYREKMFTGLSS